MDPRVALIQLHARWAELISQGPQPRQSVLYYEAAALGVEAGPRVMRWLANITALEEFVATERRWPRASVGPAADNQERRLAQWVRNQRRRADDLSTYQRERLEALPGFSLYPREDRWDRHLCDLRSFISETGRLPAVRSSSDREHRLAIWLRRQRALSRVDKLPQHRWNDLLKVLGGEVAKSSHHAAT